MIFRKMLIAVLVVACLGHATLVLAVTIGADGVLEFSFCVDENPYPPLLYTDRDGAIPILVKMAAREAGVRAQIQRAPLLRCLAKARAGDSDGYPSAPWIEVGRDIFVYPGAPNSPTDAFATATARQLVYRRKGEAIDWDGRAFFGLKRPILSNSGGFAASTKLRALGVVFDDNAKSTENNLAKLIAGRGDAVVAFELTANVALAQERFKDKVEALSVPFIVDNYFLAVTPAVYRRYPKEIEAFWQAIARLRRSPQYETAVRQLPL